ncbi:UNVERIFIED_CONTAM: hypothetical protein PYX00_000875 [Menopon gallinae]|uniref:Uncharacterized protein n=1 Tax=Menopon gallinae TaxID=328185 RepID=A0AAW2ICU1_9NEOP
MIGTDLSPSARFSVAVTALSPTFTQFCKWLLIFKFSYLHLLRTENYAHQALTSNKPNCIMSNTTDSLILRKQSVHPN